jgi:predicted O-methyltransferase YrrM
MNTNPDMEISTARSRVLEASHGTESAVPLPEKTGGWGMGGDTLSYISRLVGLLRPRHIIEFGSGLSTQVLAMTAASLEKPCVLTSIDHDPEYGTTAASALPNCGHPVCPVRSLIAPLVARDCGGKMLPTYRVQREQFASTLPADLIVIDGPPVMLGGREGMLYQAIDFARPGSIILLDDSNREQERTALARWIDLFGGAIEVLSLPCAFKGLAAVIVRKVVTRSEIGERRLARACEDLRRAVADEAQLLVVGEDWWREAVTEGLRTVPFTEHEGRYNGPPPDDDAALRELERLINDMDFLVIGWPYFWWLDFYPALRRKLEDYPQVFSNDRLLIFQTLRSK